MEKHPATPSRRSTRKRPRSSSTSPTKPNTISPQRRNSPKRPVAFAPSNKSNLPSRQPKARNACESHSQCAPVHRAHFIRLVDRVLLEAELMTRFVPMDYMVTWVDGLEEIDKMIDGGFWNQDKCRFCFIERFLASKGCFPWLAGVLYLKEMTAYDRSMACLEALEDDVKELDNWIKTLISAVVDKTNV